MVQAGLTPDNIRKWEYLKGIQGQNETVRFVGFDGLSTTPRSTPSAPGAAATAVVVVVAVGGGSGGGDPAACGLSFCCPPYIAAAYACLSVLIRCCGGVWLFLMLSIGV